MQRVTMKHLEAKVEAINRMSKTRYGVTLDQAYGMVQLYIIDKEVYKEHHTLVSHHTSGTKREIGIALDAMTTALYRFRFCNL